MSKEASRPAQQELKDLPLQQLLAKLNVNPEHGLSTSEVEKRLKLY